MLEEVSDIQELAAWRFGYLVRGASARVRLGQPRRVLGQQGPGRAHRAPSYRAGFLFQQIHQTLASPDIVGRGRLSSSTSRASGKLQVSMKVRIPSSVDRGDHGSAL